MSPPRCLPASTTVRSAFLRHTLDGAEVRATLLDAAVRLALLRRRGHQAGGAVTLTFPGSDSRRDPP
ncbi:hypothetical protein [Streptomyces qaidamensis]|uniref:hypothetical protein n=1 Tax=Streptomyces qaidamensis TaxID=1783515 RepID=UPI00131C786F|nr:hypothetical protein [Streptomyces qaidamensis]